jgi:hypothetical protein
MKLLFSSSVAGCLPSAKLKDRIDDFSDDCDTSSSLTPNHSQTRMKPSYYLCHWMFTSSRALFPMSYCSVAMFRRSFPVAKLQTRNVSMKNGEMNRNQPTLSTKDGSNLIKELKEALIEKNTVKLLTNLKGLSLQYNENTMPKRLKLDIGSLFKGSDSLSLTPAEVATVLHNLGEMGFSAKVNNEKLLFDKLIRRYLESEEIKSTKSFSLFISALNASNYTWGSLNVHRQKDIFPLFNLFNDSNQLLVVTDFSTIIYNLGEMKLTWHDLPISAREICFTTMERSFPTINSKEVAKLVHG